MINILTIVGVVIHKWRSSPVPLRRKAVRQPSPCSSLFSDLIFLSNLPALLTGVNGLLGTRATRSLGSGLISLAVRDVYVDATLYDFCGI